MTEPTANPLLQPWQTPFGLPPFDADPARALRPGVRARDADAPRRGRRHRRRAASRRRSTTPSRRSTAAAATSGASRELFFNLTASETSPALQAVEREISPRLAAHYSAIHLHAGLFARIDELFQRRDALAAHPGAAAAHRTDPPRFRARRRPASRRGKSALRARSSSALPSSRPASARTFWPTKPATVWSCATSAISPACRRTCAPPRARRRRSAARPTSG